MVDRPPSPHRTAPRRWARALAVALAAGVLLLAAGYGVRRTLLLAVARVFLDRDPDLAAQEKADGIRIVFAPPPTPWVAPLKNVMNPMWQSIGAAGVNYYTYAGPADLLSSYSERSDPGSSYYQAWVGGYVTKRQDGTLPENLQAWARQVTELDQRSWLAAMGDPAPLAESESPTRAGNIVVDGRSMALWHGTMRSHSDLSASADTPLAMLVGMPPQSRWPATIHSFHDLTLDGYFVAWSDASRRVSIVVYAVAAIPPDRAAPGLDPRRDAKAELLGLMRTATVQPAGP